MVLFGLARDHHCYLATSQYAIHEARRNLIAKKPEMLHIFSDILACVEILPEADIKRLEQAASIGLTVIHIFF